MGMWTAPSDFDYLDEQERWDRQVTMTCSCGAEVRVLYRDGPPLGPTRCDSCQQQAVNETLERLKSQGVR